MWGLLLNQTQVIGGILVSIGIPWGRVSFMFFIRSEARCGNLWNSREKCLKMSQHSLFRETAP